jgi:toluene monooxygenase system protein E
MSRQPPPALRTYSHLAAAGAVPSEYEIVSSRLLYHPTRGFETNVPLASWYERHQRDARLQCPDWEAFADPRATTYAAYTALSARNEQHLDALAASEAAASSAEAASSPWPAIVEDVLPPMRHVWHGFQMIAAYIGQMAPAGRITLVALFQGADEMRRVHRAAQRMGQLRETAPDFGAHSKQQWTERPAWQPLREVLERALVAYDWGESFTALCLALKPCIDELVLAQLTGLARANGDFLLGETLASLAEDARWHRSWALRLVDLLLQPGPAQAGNRVALAEWLDRWLPRARAAARALAPLLGDAGPSAAARAEEAVTSWLRGLDLGRA